VSDQLRPARQRLAKPGDVGRSEPLLGWPMQDGDILAVLGEAIGDPPGAVWR
jgi:hypothetical protein